MAHDGTDVSHTADGRWTGDPARKLRYEQTELGRARTERYEGSVTGIARRLRNNHERREQAIHASRAKEKV